jgi:aminomethyltransferase
VRVTRTGYTGDLGYEIWVPGELALPVWDALIDAGRDHGIEPAGLDALDLTRIEAGFIMLEVDYYSAVREVLESRKSSPFELGLGWTVNLDRGPFVGHRALAEEKAEGSAWQMVGVEVSWEGIETLYESYGLPPNLPAAASREPLPIYAGGHQVGRMTSHAWSPLLKRSIGLASIRTSHSAVGTPLEIEHTVEFERRTVAGRVARTPFFDPERKRRP